jgi:ABC-type polysaccharide/polyol phosphate transport system ATPase subunit/SAM-dependent methyltransferase
MPAIDIRSVSKKFLLRHNASAELKVKFLGLLHREKRESVEEFWALRDVSLRIDHGEAVGLVGRNGSGKSTLLKMIAAVYRPTSGRLLVTRNARISSMIELGVGFHPELTGRENVFLSAAIHGLTRAEIESVYDDIVAYSGLEHFMDVPVKNYSSGMYVRLGFAIAVNRDPDILLLDEIFAVGDADFQQRCVDTIKGFLDRGKTMIFVSHDSSSVRAMCRRVALLDHGRLLFDGDVHEGITMYEQGPLRQAALGHNQSPAAMEGDVSLDDSPHRRASGGHWQASGEWQFDLLRRHGLKPEHYVLDVACGSLAAAIHFLPYLDEHRYWGVERNRAWLIAGFTIELPRAGVSRDRGYFLVDNGFELKGTPDCFDFAIANSVFPSASFNAVARCIATVLTRLKPSGVFFATWFENPDGGNFEPIVRESGVVTYPDREPYHYPFALLEAVCDALGARVERLHDRSNPRGESVLAITRGASAEPLS